MWSPLLCTVRPTKLFYNKFIISIFDLYTHLINLYTWNYRKTLWARLGIVVHSFNPSIREAETLEASLLHIVKLYFKKIEKKVKKKKKKWAKGVTSEESLRRCDAQHEHLLQDLVWTCGYVSPHACYPVPHIL